MAEYEIEFQEIHRRVRQTITADSLDHAWDEADKMLPDIAKERRWLPEQAFVSRIRLVVYHGYHGKRWLPISARKQNVRNDESRENPAGRRSAGRSAL